MIIDIVRQINYRHNINKNYKINLWSKLRRWWCESYVCRLLIRCTRSTSSGTKWWRKTWTSTNVAKPENLQRFNVQQPQWYLKQNQQHQEQQHQQQHRRKTRAEKRRKNCSKVRNAKWFRNEQIYSLIKLIFKSEYERKSFDIIHDYSDLLHVPILKTQTWRF